MSIKTLVELSSVVDSNKEQETNAGQQWVVEVKTWRCHDRKSKTELVELIGLIGTPNLD